MFYKFLISTLLLFSNFASVNSSTDILIQFSDFINTYNKNYSKDEIVTRFDIFKNNLKKIEDHNSQGHSWNMTVNKFADLTSDEFKYKYTCYNKNKNFLRSNHIKLDNFDNLDESLPTSLDWTTKGVVTPVKDQASCGSCWAFSSISSIESAYAISTGKLVSLSEQQLVDCSTSFGNQGCSGGLFVPSFKYAEKTGICSEKDYPYKGTNGKCKKCTPVTKVNSYVEVIANSESALQKAVNIGPVSVAIEADTSLFQLYHSGVINSVSCGYNLDHGVEVVGWGTLNGTDYWKIKNSWGSSWGSNGYVLIARNTKDSRGMCGVAMEPSYPVISHGLE